MGQSREVAKTMAAFYSSATCAAFDRVTQAETTKNRVTPRCKVGMSCRVGEEPKNGSWGLSTDRTLHPYRSFSHTYFHPQDSDRPGRDARMHIFVGKSCACVGTSLLNSLSLLTRMIAQAFCLTREDTKI